MTPSLMSTDHNDNNNSNKKKGVVDKSANLSRKKQYTINQSGDSSNKDLSGAEDWGTRVPSASQSFFIKSLSSISDITDSNRDSSSNNSGSGSGSDDARNDQISNNAMTTFSIGTSSVIGANFLMTLIAVANSTSKRHQTFIARNVVLSIMAVPFSKQTILVQFIEC